MKWESRCRGSRRSGAAGGVQGDHTPHSFTVEFAFGSSGKGAHTPPSREGSIVYPGNFGTFNWGAVAVDPDRDMMFSMSVHLAFTVKMIPRADATTRVATRESEPAFNENPGAPYAATRGPSTRH